jgi:thiol:disulfide interchange protein DsbD
VGGRSRRCGTEAPRARARVRIQRPGRGRQDRRARFTIASGYYLYREKLHFSVEPATLASAPSLPSGVIKDDEFFGKVETYRGQLAVRLALQPTHGQQSCRAGRVARVRRRRSVLSAPGSKRYRDAAAARDAARRAGAATPTRKSWFN